ncbi:MAG: S41 family peptidase [Bacteroidota bacterium]
MIFGKTTIFFILCHIIISQLCYSQKKENPFTKKFPPYQLKKDAQLLQDVFLSMHPVQGIYKPKSYYDEQFNHFKQSLTDSLTEKEFRIKLKLLIGRMNCGHTDVMYSKNYLKNRKHLKINYSPYVFVPIQNKVYVYQNLNKKQDSVLKEGTEISEINGIPVDSILRMSQNLISVDGYNASSKNHYTQIAFNSFYASLLEWPDTFRIKYKQWDGLKSTTHPAFNGKKVIAIPFGPKKDSLMTHYKRAKISYRFLDSANNIMLMKINSFSIHKYQMAYKKLFAKLNKNKSENLIIDLRNNGGGSIKNALQLLSYLIDSSQTLTMSTSIKEYPFKKNTHGNLIFKLTRIVFNSIAKKTMHHDTVSYSFDIKPKQTNHFNRHIFVLINGGSFSASCIVAAYLKYKNRAPFIGEETGGAIEGCNAGITPYYKLPNTKLRVRIPAYRISNDVIPNITGHGIIPDYKMDYSLTDLIQHKDIELLKALELIKNL